MEVYIKDGKVFNSRNKPIIPKNNIYGIYDNGIIKNYTLEQLKAALNIEPIREIKTEPKEKPIKQPIVKKELSKGFKRSDETRYLMSIAKQRFQYSIKGVVYNSIIEAIEATGLTKQQIIYRSKHKIADCYLIDKSVG